MKVGVVGLGSIANKAYLPVLGTRSDLELTLMTRNQQVLAETMQRYRVSTGTTSLDELMADGIEAAFVHASTESHYEIVSHLLESGIHVFVDKPLDTDIERSEQLVELAEKKERSLMVGFNRRFAPAYVTVQENASGQMITLQKNRENSRGHVRTIIYDDFIHVVDTLLFYLGTPVEHINIQHAQTNGILSYVTAHLSSQGKQAIGIMHRHSGFDEETLEVFESGTKWRVSEVREIVKYQGTAEYMKPARWSTTYQERGFEAMIDYFIQSVRTGKIISARGALESHRICETIAQQIEQETLAKS